MDMEQASRSHTLIASDRVEGTPVRRANGQKIGTIERLMIDKLSGNVAYAVLTFGGFLGMGEKYHPLPWSTLTYDTNKEGYVVNLSKEQLRDAPVFDEDEETFLSDRDYEKRVHDYYGTTPYWGL